MMKFQWPEPPLANCGAYLEKAIPNVNRRGARLENKQQI